MPWLAALAATLDTSGTSGDRVIGEHTERNMSDLMNSVVGYWTEKQVVNRVLVDLDVNRGDTPLELNQGQHEIEVYFTNPEPDATSFFGANQTVVAKRLNEAEDESGLDVTDWVPLSYTWYTDRVKIHYINNRQDLIHITQDWDFRGYFMLSLPLLYITMLLACGCWQRRCTD